MLRLTAIAIASALLAFAGGAHAAATVEALDAAIGACRADSVDGVLKTGVNAQTLEASSPLSQAIRGCAEKPDQMARIVDLLLAAGAPVKNTDVLHTLARYAQADPQPVLARLVAAGADLNARDEDGETPVMVSYTQATALVFISAGSDLMIRNKDELSMLDIAQARDWGEAVEAIYRIVPCTVAFPAR